MPFVILLPNPTPNVQNNWQIGVNLGPSAPVATHSTAFIFGTLYGPQNSRPPAINVPDGTCFFTTDTLVLAQSQEGEWVQIQQALARQEFGPFTTESLAQYDSQVMEWTISRGFVVFQIQVSQGSRLQLYTTPQNQAADAERPPGQSPAPGSGLIIDLITDPDATDIVYDLSPPVWGFSTEASGGGPVSYGTQAPGLDTITACVTNYATATAEIMVNMTGHVLEP